MAKQTINIGSSANDKTGDPLRTAFNKINENFTELYGASPFGQQVTISGNQVSANESNADLVLSGSGTGGVVASAVRIDGTSLSSSDSTQININENLDVGGNITASGNITATGDIFANGNINLGNASSDQTKVVGVFEADNIQIDGTTITTNTTNGSVTITGNSTGGVVVENLTVNDNTISSPSNSDIVIEPGGTGDVVLSALRINGTTLDSSDSSAITLAEAVDITGALTGTSGSFSTTLAVTGATTLTGATTINNSLTANSVTTNTIASNGSNADLSIQPSGTGDVLISALRINGTTLDSSDSTAITLAENVDVTGTLTTKDVTTTGNHVITGTSEIGSDITVKGSLIADNLTTNSDGDLTLNPAGSGEIVFSGNVAHTGTQTTTGQLNTDNLRFDGNTISTTNSNGGLILAPNGAGSITLDAQTVQLDNTLAVGFVAVSNTLFMMRGSKIHANQTNDDIVLESNGTGSVVLDLVSITDNKITTHVSNADLQLDTDGTGLIDILTDTQSTVGSAGGASALPGQPTGYIKIKVAGTTRVIPFYDQS
tara:strand:+ start:254 stop:1894 length:1641 start_codon:yes stop_codon:yes gene_type:complete